MGAKERNSDCRSRKNEDSDAKGKVMGPSTAQEGRVPRAKPVVPQSLLEGNGCLWVKSGKAGPGWGQGQGPGWLWPSSSLAH